MAVISVVMNATLVKYSSNLLSFLCAGMLFIAIFRLPIAYYMPLRVMVFTGALLVIIRNLNNNLFWVIIFLLAAILFNPILPVYLHRKFIWIPLDIITGILFLLEIFIKGTRKKSIKAQTKKRTTYPRDRIY